MATATPLPLAVGLDEAARLTGLCRRSIESLIFSGRVPSRKIGRRRLILYRDLQRLLSNDVPAISAPGGKQ